MVQADLADLGQVRTDEVAEVQRQALSGQLEDATKELVTVQARLARPELDDRGARGTSVRGNRAAEATIAAIGPLLEGLPASSETVADTRARLEALVLQRRLRDLESQYIATALRQAQGGTDGLVGVPFLVDRSGDPVSPILAVAIGLVAGVLLAGMAVLASDRYKDPVRTVDDVPGLTAIRVSRRPRKLAGAVDWYQTAGGDARRVDIQALRARIDRLVGRGKVVLLAGVDASSRDVMDVAVDLASAVAVTGRTVLFLDTRVTEPSPLPVGGSGADPRRDSEISEWSRAGPIGHQEHVVGSWSGGSQPDGGTGRVGGRRPSRRTCRSQLCSSGRRSERPRRLGCAGRW